MSGVQGADFANEEGVDVGEATRDISAEVKDNILPAPGRVEKWYITLIDGCEEAV